MKKSLELGMVSVGLLVMVGTFFISYQKNDLIPVSQEVSVVSLQEVTMQTEEEEMAIEENYVPMEAPVLPVEVQKTADELVSEVENLAKIEEAETDKCANREKCEKEVENTFQVKFEALLKKYEKYF